MTSYNSTKDPIWIAQMSDLHISPIYNVSLPRVNETMKFIAQKIHPLFTLLTGDITDDLDEKSVWSPAYPHEEHFQLYQKIRENSGIPEENLIEILGNHDTWARHNFDRDFKYFVNGDKMKKNFYVQSYEKNGIRIIAFCPVHFPTGHTTYHYVIPMYPEMLDALEDALNEPTNAKATIFSMHFTIGMMSPLEFVYSTKTKRNLKQILSDPRYNIVAMLNGHTHPNNGEFGFDWLHYGSTIEITATALLERDGFGIFSMDNNRINYKIHTQHESKIAFLTSPGHDRIATRIFTDNNFQIRVVSLTPNANHFQVTGDVNGMLKFDRDLEGGAKLYSLDVHLPNGKHTIQINGDLNETCEFSIGQPAGPFYEEKFCNLLGWVMMVWFGLITIFQLLVLIAEILPIPEKYRFWIQINNRISHPTSNVNAKKPNLFIESLCSPFIIGEFLKKLPLFQRIFMIFITIYPYFFPIGIELFEGEIGFWMINGVYFQGKTTFDVVSFMFDFFYVALIVGGFQYLFVNIVISQGKCAPKLENLWSHLLVGLGHLFWIQYGLDRHLPLIYRITFQFHLIPMIGLLLYSIHVKQLKAKEPTVKQN